jgi:hypothetical protein
MPLPLATESRQDCRVSNVRSAATASARRNRPDREDIGLAHTLLFLYRCVAGLTRRSFRSGSGSRPLPTVGFLAIGCVAGCFTDPINRAPVVGDVHQVGTAGRGKTATFMASGFDPDQDQITWTWAKEPGDCPGQNDPSTWPNDRTSGPAAAPATYVLDDPTLTSGRYCVWAFATDRYGATGAYPLTVDPADNPPIAVIRVVNGLKDAYPAYTAFELTAADSIDPDDDPLSYSWELHPPPGSMAIFIPCAGESSVNDDDTRRCFKADVSGQFQYGVSLTASDGKLASMANLQLNVLADIPPCIVSGVPQLPPGNPVPHQSYTNPSPVSVTVTDDGDTDQVHYTWFKSTNSAKLQYVDNADWPSLHLTASDYHPLDTANVRVEVRDRNVDEINQFLAACKDADFCPNPMGPAGAVCYLRATWHIVMDLPASGAGQ